MKKLSLTLESLTVESFATDGAAGTRGTVKGHDGTTYADESCNGTCVYTCYPASCMSCEFTCDQTCNGCGGSRAYTCGGNTCQGTCDYATCAQPETCWLNIC